MFDIGFFEIVFIGIIMLLILGPEKMPHAVRMTGAWIGKIKRGFTDAKYEIERQIQLEEFKNRVNEQKKKIESTLLETTELTQFENTDVDSLPNQPEDIEDSCETENCDFEPLPRNTDEEPDTSLKPNNSEPKNEI